MRRYLENAWCPGSQASIACEEDIMGVDSKPQTAFYRFGFVLRAGAVPEARGSEHVFFGKLPPPK